VPNYRFREVDQLLKTQQVFPILSFQMFIKHCQQRLRVAVSNSFQHW